MVRRVRSVELPYRPPCGGRPRYVSTRLMSAHRVAVEMSEKGLLDSAAMDAFNSYCLVQDRIVLPTSTVATGADLHTMGVTIAEGFDAAEAADGIWVRDSVDPDLWCLHTDEGGMTGD